MKGKTTSQNFIRVHFFTPVDNKTDFFYGSLKAIFEEFTAEEIGCTIDTLYGHRIKVNGPKVTNKCIITYEVLTRVANKR